MSAKLEPFSWYEMLFSGTFTNSMDLKNNIFQQMYALILFNNQRVSFDQNEIRFTFGLNLMIK